MNKSSQSLLDFVFPFNAVQPEVLTGHDTKTLMSIWQSDKDGDGFISVPKTVDPLDVSRLITKGLVVSKQHGFLIGSGTPKVTITKKGSELLKSIILQNESSAFDKKSSSSVMVKCASVQDRPNNWLKKVINGNYIVRRSEKN